MEPLGSAQSPDFRGRRGLAAPLRAGLAALALKLYSLGLLYAVFLGIPAPGDYRAFVFVPDGQSRAARLQEIRASFLERLAPYDGQFYLDISEHGYRRFGEAEAKRGPPGNYAFFPLYPAILGLARRTLGHRGGIAATLVLNLALSAVAAALLYRLAARLRIPPWPSVLLLLAFPTAIFQSLLYTESLFLALSLGATLVAYGGPRWAGALLGYLSGLTRPQGVLLACVLLPCGGSKGRTVPGRRKLAAAFVARLAPALAPIAGLATFAVVLSYTIAEPLSFLGIQARWGRGFSLGGLLGELARPWAYEGPPLDLFAALFGIGLLPWLWKHLPWPLAFYGTASVALPLSTGTALSMSRFLSVSFPHVLALAKILEGRRAVLLSALALFVVLQCLVARGAIAWRFVG